MQGLTPERISLPPRPDAPRSPKPPVRMFLGTEPAQHRAERAFIFSIHKYRDPGRAYEIHLMRSLVGYRRWFWTTDFTNYRFAIPHYAGGCGRAIYNDVDQVYVADPGELFDLEMGDHGYLAVSERDTSVMLIDCERMAGVWKLDDALWHRKHWMIDRAVERAGLAGPLPGEWNARDSEYRADQSKCVHFTTMHLQPWRPYPKRFVYRENPAGHVFHRLEQEAEQAGFHVFDRERPSEAWRTAQNGSRRAGISHLEDSVRDLIRRVKARSLLRVTAGGRGDAVADPERLGVDSAIEGSLRWAVSGPPGSNDERFDGVACFDGLDQVAAQDADWVIEGLFQRAKSFVFAAVCDEAPRRRRLPNPPPHRVHTARWWAERFEVAARRYPEVHWQLILCRDPAFAASQLRFRQGGRFPGDAPPSVCVLVDGKPGHTTQAIGLAEGLGWPYERIDLELSRLADLPNGLLGRTTRGLTAAGRAVLTQRAKPDLVIAAGRRTAPVTKWIRRASRGRTRVVQLGRMGVSPPEAFDLTVVPGYGRLVPDPSRIEAVLPLTRVRKQVLDEAGARWAELLEAHPGPRIAVLVGGQAPHYRLTPQLAVRMGGEIMQMARNAGGSVFVTTSRRTPAAAVTALQETMAGAAHFHRWDPDGAADHNPYLGFLARADAFVVTGESASMIAEACATGRPVFLYDIPRGVPGWRGIGPGLVDAVSRWLVDRSDRNALSRRGIPRPQRGLELVLSRLLARGLIRAGCDYSVLHAALYAAGIARPFDGRYEPFEPSSIDDVARATARVKQMLGVPAA